MFTLGDIFFFNDTATTEIYTLSLHDALPISTSKARRGSRRFPGCTNHRACSTDRKSTRLNSSHSQISYAVFCLKKKKPLLIPDRPSHSATHVYSRHALLALVSPSPTPIPAPP